MSPGTASVPPKPPHTAPATSSGAPALCPPIIQPGKAGLGGSSWACRVDGRTTQPPLTACEAAGLEVAVRAWWHGAPGRITPRGIGRAAAPPRAEDAWLRGLLVRWPATAVRARLQRAGIPERMIEGGLQLGRWLSEDEEVRRLWSQYQSQQDDGSHSEFGFAVHAVRHVQTRFDVRAAPATCRPSSQNGDVKVAPTPSLMLAPRTRSSSMPPGHGNGVGAHPPRRNSCGPSTPKAMTAREGCASAPPGGVHTELEEPFLDAGRTSAPPAHPWDEAAASNGAEHAATPREAPGTRSSRRSFLPPGALTGVDMTRKSHRRSFHHDHHDPRRSTLDPERFGIASSSIARMSATAPMHMTGRLSTASATASMPVGSARVGRVPKPITTDFEATEESQLTQKNSNLAGLTGPTPRQSASAAWHSEGMPSTRASVRGTGNQSNFDKWMTKVRASIAVQKIQDVSKESEKMEKKKNEEPEALFRGKSKKTNKKQRIISDLTEVRRVFDSFDQDGSGFIEPHEFLPLLAKLLCHPQSEIDKMEVWRNWDAVDQDGSGQISYDEFQRWYCDKFGIVEMPDFRQYFSDDIVTDDQKLIRTVAKNIGVDALIIEKIWIDFKTLDNDDSGKLEFDEFKRLVQRQLAGGSAEGAEEVPPKVIEKFWMDIDADGSGNVNFEEFASWYLKFFVGDISPMEHYYHLLGSGYRRKQLQNDE